MDRGIDMEVEMLLVLLLVLLVLFVLFLLSLLLFFDFRSRDQLTGGVRSCGVLLRLPMEPLMEPLILETGSPFVTWSLPNTGCMVYPKDTTTPNRKGTMVSFIFVTKDCGLPNLMRNFSNTQSSTSHFCSILRESVAPHPHVDPSSFFRLTSCSTGHLITRMMGKSNTNVVHFCLVSFYNLESTRIIMHFEMNNILRAGTSSIQRIRLEPPYKMEKRMVSPDANP